MANVAKKPEILESSNIDSRKKENRGPKKQSKFSKWVQFILSGDFLFSNNFKRSPIWFVIYVVLLILLYIGMRFEPVKRYYSMRHLNNDLVNCNYRNNEIKAQLQNYQSPCNLIQILSKDGFEYANTQPVIIKVYNHGNN